MQSRLCLCPPTSYSCHELSLIHLFKAICSALRLGKSFFPFAFITFYFFSRCYRPKITWTLEQKCQEGSSKSTFLMGNRMSSQTRPHNLTDPPLKASQCLKHLTAAYCNLQPEPYACSCRPQISLSSLCNSLPQNHIGPHYWKKQCLDTALKLHVCSYCHQAMPNTLNKCKDFLR